MGEGATIDLTDEENIVISVEKLKESVDNVENLLDLMIGANAYDKLSLEDQVKHDLFASYALTSLYWMYLRTLGENPSEHVVKGEIDRIQDYVKRYQQVKDRKKRPQLQKAAARRFVKNGLWDPTDGPQPSNKKRRFDESNNDQ